MNHAHKIAAGVRPEGTDEPVFHLVAADYGVPSRDELVALRIWDGHYHGIGKYEEVMEYADRMGIERVVSLDVGGGIGRGTPAERREREERDRRVLEEWPDKISGIIRIDPSQPEASVAHMEKWIRNGPAIGIKYAGGNPGGITCDHPNNDPIIALADELNAVIYIHTWLKVGGNPPYVGGGNLAGESSPMDVARLAERFPHVEMICGHSGGDWEIGVRAIRPHENVYFEFSGSDPHSGQVDLAVAELGADRITWGGHGPSRSWPTELSKVLDGDLSQEERMKVFGRNFRRMAAPILRLKGVHVDI